MSSANHVQEQLDIFARYLKERKLKMTRQRELVAESFLKADGHLSLEELYRLVRRRDRKIGFATVFRTLKALTDCGLAREVDLDDGRTRFENLYKRPHHHHIVCVECGRTIEFLAPDLEKLQDQIVSRYRFKPVRHKLQIFGVCEDCQKEQTASSPKVDSNLVFARDALKIAIETEQRGVAFYQTASELVTDPGARQSFLNMLQDERRHLADLQKEWHHLITAHPQVLEAPVFLHFDYEALNQIFPSRREVKKKLHSDLTAEEAMTLAMKMEQDAHRFFKRYAAKFNDTRGREIFLQFAEEEREHYETIRSEWTKLRESTQG